MDSPEGAVPSFSSRKGKWLLFLLAWSAISGFAFGAAPLTWETPILFSDMIVFVVAIIRWTHLDAAERGFLLTRYFVVLMVFCPGPLIVMPVYFIRSRGWGAGALACLLAAAFLLLQFGIDAAASYLAVELVWSG